LQCHQDAITTTDELPAADMLLIAVRTVVRGCQQAVTCCVSPISERHASSSQILQPAGNLQPTKCPTRGHGSLNMTRTVTCRILSLAGQCLGDSLTVR